MTAEEMQEMSAIRDCLGVALEKMDAIIEAKKAEAAREKHVRLHGESGDEVDLQRLIARADRE